MKNREEPKTEKEKLEQIHMHAQEQIKMIDAYGGDNPQSKAAKADAETRLICSKYLLERWRQRWISEPV